MWLAECGGDPVCPAMAVMLDIIGIPLAIVGLVLIPVGFARYANYRRWQQSRGLALFERGGLRLDLALGPARAPLAGATHLSSGTLGLQLTF
jgi:hypothetical protein